MRIDPADTMAGLPLVKVRDFLRRTHALWLDVEVVSRSFDIDTAQGQQLLDELRDRGYIEPWGETRAGKWTLTVAGSGLLMASTARPVKRAAAQRHLDGFIARLDEVNRDPDLLHWCTEAYLFGSMLDEQRTHVNDVDLAIRLQRRPAQDFTQASLDFAASQQAAGRRFANYTEYAFAPELEIKRRLRARSRLLNLHDADRDEGFKSSPNRLLYRFEPPSAEDHPRAC